MRVSNVLIWLAAGLTAEEITTEYPYLSATDIRAALEFAARALDSSAIAAE